RFRGLFLHRTGVEALGIDVAVDEFDHRHRRVVAVAKAGLDDAGIAALAVLVAGGENVEQLSGLVEIAHLGDRLPAHRKTALLAERHQLFDDRAQFLRLRQRGDDLLVLDQRRAHIGKHRAPMFGGAIELAMNLAVTHGVSPELSWPHPSRRGQQAAPQDEGLDLMVRRALARLEPRVGEISNGLRSAWPARRYSPAASPALPFRGAAPSGP